MHFQFYNAISISLRFDNSGSKPAAMVIGLVGPLMLDGHLKELVNFVPFRRDNSSPVYNRRGY